MERHEKKHILLMGLDHRMLWQLTRTLADLEDLITIDCVKDPSNAKEICDREDVDAIVVDGWEQAWQSAHHLSGDQAFEGGSWKWIILVESLPLECLPAGRPSPSAVLLEKPFNPKEFPSFLMKVVERREMPEAEAVPPEPPSTEVSLPLVPGESYREPDVPRAAEEGPEERVEAEIDRVEQVAEPAEAPDFHQFVDRGFACLSEKDWNGAKEQWSEALRIRPNDERLHTNLRRLEKMMRGRSD